MAVNIPPQALLDAVAAQRDRCANDAAHWQARATVTEAALQAIADKAIADSKAEAAGEEDAPKAPQLVE